MIFKNSLYHSFGVEAVVLHVNMESLKDFSTDNTISPVLQNRGAQHLVTLSEQLAFHVSEVAVFAKRGSLNVANVVTEKTCQGYQKMTQAQLIHLAQSTMSCELNQALLVHSVLFPCKRTILIRKHLVISGTLE